MSRTASSFEGFDRSVNADLAEGLSGPSRRSALPTGAFIAHAKWLVVALIAALISNFGGVVGGIKMIGYTYSQSEDNILTPKAVGGLFLFIFGLCAGPLSAGLAAVYATRTCRSRIIRAGIPFIISASSFGAVAASVAYLMQIPITFRQSPMPDNFRQTLGGWVGVVYSGLGLATLAMTIIQLRAGVEGPASGLGLPTGVSAAAGFKPRPIQPDRLRDNACAIAAFFVLGAVCFTLTTFLSSCWNYSATSYFTTPANPTNSLTTTATWTFPQPAAAPGEVWYPAKIYLKIYPDVVVYFVSIFGLVAAGVAATFFPGVRRALHKRLGGPFASSFFFNRIWPEGVTRGEALVVLVVVWLYGYWAWYWGVHYSRLNSGVSDPSSPIADEIAVMQDPNASLQKAARVLGHITTLTMSFLTYPLARNSVWESAFGIPFDRAVKWHRLAGRLAWAFVTAHMVVWQIKWIREGTLWNNVVTIDNLTITPAKGPDDPLEGDEVHADNFTVVVAEFGWLVLTLSLVAANFSRRWNYELFHYLHHAVWIFFLTALFHAWSHWQYMIVGLTLYAVDKLTRMVNASRSVRVRSISSAAGITRLEIASKAAFASTGGSHYAGQYAFINIPGIAPLQWHPFTVSSAPHARDAATGEQIATFHIRNMGAGTWTHALAGLAADAGAPSAPSLGAMPISVDGPYGRPGHYYERETVIMIAGGIGITPFHSIICDLHARALAPGAVGSPGSVKRVHLVWVVRDPALLHVFADTLAAVSRENPNGSMFSLHLHLTDGSSSASKAGKGKGMGASLLANAEGGTLGSAPLLTSGGSGAGAYEVAPTGSAPAGSGSASSSRSPVAAGFCRASNATLVDQLTVRGRPDLKALFTQVASAGAGSALQPSDRVTVMVCGPTPMVVSASTLAAEHGFDFHSEVFNF